ncbi:sensor histidine kinase [Lapidilactobacillus concavus DSM 17758]|jgi:signal transduction histidine kinase|uniref:histidine kinase n=1 Tax=Lapidilactobacillus concavus DSM 17758 TaxID=1423735 RepID=A0A0R1W3H6_9LACO|nr:sensor histidine kinase [Lapidilactobacillus concavus DSM 17758]GEL12795.1 two-component sensor histidine kinase [Lapidilactobacillus concavus]
MSDEPQTIVLKTREKWELFLEGLVTVGLLLLLNFAVVILIDQAIHSNQGLVDGIYQIKRAVTIGPWHLWSWQRIFFILLIIFDAIVVYWRLIRRYHQMQMRHIIEELHFIANGHLDHRVNLKVSGYLNQVIDSINALVDSTVNSMIEERKIEASKDELITNVSHDIRTPLTSIMGYLGLIENGQYENEDDLLRYIHIAFEKTKQMKSLVEDLFEFTKVQQTHTQLEVTTFDLVSMLEQLTADFELEAQKHHILIEVDVTQRPIMMSADAGKLVRVFSNLIVNALKYGDEATKITLSAHQENNDVVISVANDGRQIPQEDLENIFERFYRVEGSRSAETGGSGLGLAIAQSIVKLHGGEIYATSTEQETAFNTILPLNRHQQEEN